MYTVPSGLRITPRSAQKCLHFKEQDVDYCVFKVTELAQRRDVVLILFLIHFQTAYRRLFKEKLGKPNISIRKASYAAPFGA